MTSVPSPEVSAAPGSPQPPSPLPRLSPGPFPALLSVLSFSPDPQTSGKGSEPLGQYLTQGRRRKAVSSRGSSVQVASAPPLSGQKPDSLQRTLIIQYLLNSSARDSVTKQRAGGRG